MQLPLVRFTIVFTIFTFPTSIGSAASPDYEYYRLPTDLVPLEYDIRIIPYLETPADRAFTFEGHVTVVFNVSRITTLVRFHAFNLNITEDSLKVQELGALDPEDISFSFYDADQDRQFFTIALSKALKAGSHYTLDIDFSGIFTDDLFGFYRSSYTNSDGIKRWLAATFFQASGARQAFPCWDEPIWRANFTLHVAHEPDYHVIANMPKSGEDTPLLEKPELTDWMWSHFLPTVRQASYLVAEVGWARGGAEHQAVYGVSVAPRIISQLGNLTGQFYPLPKMDHVALPDFIYGAEENWGLMTYRETAFLFENGVSSVANRQRVATVIAHEAAHQWFGNLVTPKWWDNLWLSEGFATYLEYHAIAPFEPGWQLDHQFILEEMYVALQSDGLESTHPIHKPVGDPNGDPIFDGLTYTKGGPMVRCLLNLMGEENFKLGIQSYLAKFSFSNADSDDLWNALQPYVPSDLLPTDVDLSEVMNPWIKQAGYPLITVNRNYNNNNNTAIITQSRFVTYTTGSLPLNESWIVPLTLTDEFENDFDAVRVKAWLQGPEVAIQLEATADQWIIFNIQQVGFYRVNYDMENWKLLISALNNSLTQPTIHPINRAQLMDDALALARANLLDYNIALDTTSYLNLETEYAPWAAALTAMSYLNDRLNFEQEGRDLFEAYMLNKLKQVYDKLGGVSEGVEGEAHITKILRILVLRWACELGHKQCTNDSKQLFTLWQQQSDPEQQNPITPDLRSVTYCVGMREGGTQEYDFLFQRYDKARNIATEQEIILKGLACSSNHTLLQSLLIASITRESGIRIQDAKNVFVSVYSNRAGVDTALEFLSTYYQEAAPAYGGMGSIGGLFAGLATKLNTQEQRLMLEQLLNDSELGAARGGVEAAILTLDQNLSWQQQHREEVLEYFRLKL